MARVIAPENKISGGRYFFGSEWKLYKWKIRT